MPDTEAFRADIEQRRNEWLTELDAFALGPKERAVLTARVQELAWVLRLIDGGEA